MNTVSFKDVGKSAWDAFCDSSPEAWLRHTSTFLDFALTLGAESRNLSFALMHNEEIVSIVPLIAQKNGESGMYEFMMGGTPTPFPALRAGLSEEMRQEAYAAICKEIETRALENGVSNIRMFVDPLTDPVLEKKYQTNPLLQFGFIDTSIQTSNIDLNKSEEELLSAVQARQRRYIRAIRGAGYHMNYFDEKNITSDACAAFETLYAKAAGRVVGTPERWRLTWDMVRKGFSTVLLVRAPNETEYCAGHVVITYKKRVYDGLSAIAPAYRSVRGIGALMHFENFLFFKQLGFSRLEVGWILPETPEGSYSKKELDISHFKSLFGGELLPLWRGEKQYR